MSTSGTTFEVSSVERAREPLPQIPYFQAVSRLLNGDQQERREELRRQVAQLEQLAARSERLGDSAGLPGLKQTLATLKQEQAALEAIPMCSLEACGRYGGRLVDDVLAHPVIEALHAAFQHHYPLSLAPDMIWLLICQGAAHHINVHAEHLRARFVQHQGQAEIRVRRNDLIKGAPENPWEEVIDALCQQVRAYIGAGYDLFMPRFSTTGLAEQVAAQIVLLDAMQSYFKYVVETRCGIPAITLEGTVDDWQELAERARGFADLGLEWWIEPLRPILQEFVAAAGGDVRPAFWQSIYKYDSYSGGAAITGWIAAFFPYLKDRQGAPTVQNPWLAQGGEKLQLLLAGSWDRQRHDMGGPAPDIFPSGQARAPFRWEYYDLLFDMELIGGFVGVAQDAATLTLRPEIGWTIREIQAV